MQVRCLSVCSTYFIGSKHMAPRYHLTARVQSGSEAEERHTVSFNPDLSVDRWRCQCKGFAFNIARQRGFKCKHIKAVRAALSAGVRTIEIEQV